MQDTTSDPRLQGSESFRFRTEPMAALSPGTIATVFARASLSQRAVADACGVSKSAVAGWIRTDRIPSQHLPTLIRITGSSIERWSAPAAPEPALRSKHSSASKSSR